MSREALFLSGFRFPMKRYSSWMRMTALLPHRAPAGSCACQEPRWPLDITGTRRIYRTGDMAYYGEDGLLYYHARRDFQIKHMGHRIELGEIEAALETVSGVGRAVCIFLEEKNKIAAFYEGDADKKMIAAGLEHLLPRYMFPNRYMNLPALPLTKNGKVDRQALRRLYG